MERKFINAITDFRKDVKLTENNGNTKVILENANNIPAWIHTLAKDFDISLHKCKDNHFEILN